MTPLQNYQRQLREKGFQADPAQERAILRLQRVYDELLAAHAPVKHSWWYLNRKLRGKHHRVEVQGLYLWGEVGAGKTWLMDLFYQSLIKVGTRGRAPLRLHFFHFMQQVHQQLTDLQGHANPLQQVAQYFAQQAHVICLDEFLVNDIGDAMILANLLEALFAENITLITTANTEPDALYRNGIQRGRFLPAIDWIKNNLEIVQVCSQEDYRQYGRDISGARPCAPTVYFYPLNETTAQQMREVFMRLADNALPCADAVILEDRAIPVIALADGVVWFDFQVLCNVPRSQMDYLAMVQRFHTVLLSNVPAIKSDQYNTVRYLINLIDILYDAKVKLIISAAVPIDEIYPVGLLAVEFQRTRSRLMEMQKW